MKKEYTDKVALLIETIPFIAEEPCFALKGGTAINLFYHDMPRLSVDIDLTYINFDDRDTAYSKINEALGRIAADLAKAWREHTRSVRLEAKSPSGQSKTAYNERFFHFKLNTTFTRINPRRGKFSHSISIPLACIINVRVAGFPYQPSLPLQIEN